VSDEDQPVAGQFKRALQAMEGFDSKDGCHLCKGDPCIGVASGAGMVLVLCRGCATVVREVLNKSKKLGPPGSVHSLKEPSGVH